MNPVYFSTLISGIVMLSGCTAMGAVSMIGSTLSRTVEIHQNKKDRGPANHRVAVTNVNLGVEYMRQGYYEKALDKLNNARKADPGYALTYNMLGVLNQILENPGEAESNFLRSLEIEKDNPSTLNNYGQFLCKQDRHEEAENLFLAAAHNPFYTTPEIAYANAGSCAHMHKRFDIAEKYFEKSLAANPDVAVALSQMSKIRFNNGDYTAAREYMDRYRVLISHTPKTLWLAIRIERHFNDLDKLASYSLLLRNKFPDTVEAELLRISEEYIGSTKSGKFSSKINREVAGKKDEINSKNIKPGDSITYETTSVELQAETAIGSAYESPIYLILRD